VARVPERPWTRRSRSLGDLDQIVGLTSREVDLITSWPSPAGWDISGAGAPPGLGKCLIKVGGRPGVPVKIQITETERRLHDTNARWTTP
jgi:hypothetical protein